MVDVTGWMADAQRARITILGAWAALSAVSVAVAFSRPGEDLDAVIERQATDNGAVLLVRNEADAEWTRARLVVDEAWQVERSAVKPGEVWLVGALDLTGRTYVPLELGDPWLAGAPGLTPGRAQPPADLPIAHVRLEVAGAVHERTFTDAK